MKHHKSELLLLTIGLIAILLSLIFSSIQKAPLSEILGRALYVPVLFAALHYGRQSGILAAAGSALIHLLSKWAEFGDFSLAVTDRQFVSRVILFGLIGIFGGKLAVKTKYLIGRLSDNGLVDRQTNLYNREYFQELVRRSVYIYHRSGRLFSILFITIDWPMGVDPPIQKNVITQLADIIRRSTRLIDEVGCINNNSFYLALPDTSALEAESLRIRLEKTCQHKTSNLSRTGAVLSHRILSMPQNEKEIIAMLPPASASRTKEKVNI